VPLRTVLTFFALAWSCLGQAPPKLGLYLRFDSPPAPLFVSTLERELSGILPIFSTRWIVGESPVPAATYSRILMVRFHGNCAIAPGDSGPESDDRIELADTVTSQGRILPYTVIDCDRLQAFPRSGGSTRTGQEANLGRAGARVLAHELYHVLLQTPEHGKKGIAKAVYTPASLLSKSMRFEEGELERIGLRYQSHPRE